MAFHLLILYYNITSFFFLLSPLLYIFSYTSYSSLEYFLSLLFCIFTLLKNSDVDDVAGGVVVVIEFDIRSLVFW